MEQLWEHTYSSMLVEMNQCKSAEKAETDQAECCYQVAVNYWEKVKGIWKEKVVYTDEDEIIFFRDIKPLFTSHIEYNVIRSQGLLFIPESLSEEVTHWKNESKRFQRLCDRHNSFIKYYNSKYRHSDRKYFLQRNNRHPLLPQERIYGDLDCRTSHDWLVRSYLANRMYHDFVTQKLLVLNG